MSAVVSKCKAIQIELLKEKDPQLYTHLTKLRIEPQLYMMRWLRILFCREFQLSDILTLWDGLFCYSRDLKLVDFFCIAMLQFVKSSCN